MKKILLFLCVATLAMTQVGFAQVQESEPNDSFDTSQNLVMGQLSVTGALVPDEFNSIFQTSGTLDSDGDNGTVSIFDLGTADGLAANTSYQVSTFENGGGVDTTLGHFSATYAGDNTNLIDDNDDGGPEGGDFYSGLNATTDAAGNLFVAVSGFGDDDWIGEHGEAGTFGLDVGTLVAASTADYFTFSGLTPGVEYTASTAPIDGGVAADTVLGWYDSSGVLTRTNDDSANAVGNYSSLFFTADASGVATLSVSGFGDIDDFSGDFNPGSAGDYTLTLVPEAVPEPSALSLFAVAGLIGLGRRRRA